MSASASRDSSLEIGSYFWLRKVERLFHTIARTESEKDWTQRSTCLSLSSIPSWKKGAGYTEGGGEEKEDRERRGCLTAINWMRLYPTNILEEEGEKRNGISFLSQPESLSVWASKSRFWAEEKKKRPSSAAYLRSHRPVTLERRKESRWWDYFSIFLNICVWSRFRHLLGFRISSSETPGKRMSRSDLTRVCAHGWWVYFSGCVCIMRSVRARERERRREREPCSLSCECAHAGFSGACVKGERPSGREHFYPREKESEHLRAVYWNEHPFVN